MEERTPTEFIHRTFAGSKVRAGAVLAFFLDGLKRCGRNGFLDVLPIKAEGDVLLAPVAGILAHPVRVKGTAAYGTELYLKGRIAAAIEAFQPDCPERRKRFAIARETLLVAGDDGLEFFLGDVDGRELFTGHDGSLQKQPTGCGIFVRKKKTRPTSRILEGRVKNRAWVGVLMQKADLILGDVLKGGEVRHKVLYVGVCGPGAVDAVVLEELDRGVDVGGGCLARLEPGRKQLRHHAVQFRKRGFGGAFVLEVIEHSLRGLLVEED